MENKDIVAWAQEERALFYEWENKNPIKASKFRKDLEKESQLYIEKNKLNNNQ